MIYHIVAVAQGRVIGYRNHMPWHFASDLRHFKKLTLGSTVLMGRRTFDSIGKPLVDRENFVLSHSPKTNQPGMRFFDSLEEAFRQVKTQNCFVIGGGSLYRQTLDRIDGIYLTKIDRSYLGDSTYPEIPSFFQEVRRSKLQDDPLLEAITYQKIGVHESASVSI